MAETGTGSAQSTQVAQSDGLDITRRATATVNFRGLSGIDGRALAYLMHPTAPGTYGAVASDHRLYGQQPLSEAVPVSVATDTAGGMRVTTRVTINVGDMGARTVGDHLWACLFAVTPAITGSVPDVAVDLGEII